MNSVDTPFGERPGEAAFAQHRTVGVSGLDEGLRKAVVLLASIPESQSAALIHQLGPDAIERLAMAANALEKMSVEEQQQLAVEFVDRQIRRGPTLPQGSPSTTESADASSIPGLPFRSPALLDPQLQRELADLLSAAPIWLAAQLVGELPQSAAVVLCCLGAEKAADVLRHVNSELQLEMVRRIAVTQQVCEFALRDLVFALAHRWRCCRLQDVTPCGGVPFVAQIVNRMDHASEKALLENLAQEDRSLVDQLLKVMFLLRDRSRVTQQTKRAA